MNPFDLSASDLLVWGIVLHLIADWPLQNDWMANNKAKRHPRADVLHKDAWFLRHPAAYLHAGIHGALLAPIFGWMAAPLALVHLVIDTRVPVVWWSRLVRQTQPKHPAWVSTTGLDASAGAREFVSYTGRGAPLMDVGMEVRFWTDQVFHIATIAVAALVVV